MLYQLVADNGSYFALLHSRTYKGKPLTDTIERVRVMDSAIWAVDKHGTRHIGQADVDKLTRVITAGIVYLVYIEELDMYAYYYSNSCNPQREHGQWYKLEIVRFRVRDGISLNQAGFTLLGGKSDVNIPASVQSDWVELISPTPLEIVTVTVAGDISKEKLKEIRNHLDYALHNFNYKFEIK